MSLIGTGFCREKMHFFSVSGSKIIGYQIHFKRSRFLTINRRVPIIVTMLESLKEFIKPGSEEESLVKKIDFSRLPKHIAVIMDGNGRWARKRRLPRVEGHRAGAKSVQEVVETCARLGVQYLTLYAFSKENWKRPRKEVATLWRLLDEYLKKEYEVLMKNKFQLKVLGQMENIPDPVRKELERVMDLTSKNDGMMIILALNYGGRTEIVDAVKRIYNDGNHGKEIESLDEKRFSEYLYTAGIPDPDLLIRTSGEFRISNFLLWQIAYAEIWITKELWPDFRKKHVLEALIDFQKRERRFGDIHPHEYSR
jgi:undecaprenyl diphosphate synthase